MCNTIYGKSDDLVEVILTLGFPGGSVVKESACSARGTEDAGSTPGLCVNVLCVSVCVCLCVCVYIPYWMAQRS